MRYALTEIEFTDPAASVCIAPDESGAGILVRYEGAPIAFVFLRFGPGCIEGPELRDLLMAEAGDEIAAELLDRELGAAPETVATLPLVTVAICTRNHPDQVARAIGSLLKMTTHPGR